MAFRERNPNSIVLPYQTKDKTNNKIKDPSRPLPVSSKENEVPLNRSSERGVLGKSSKKQDTRIFHDGHNEELSFLKRDDQPQAKKVNGRPSIWSNTLSSSFSKIGHNNIGLLKPAHSPRNDFVTISNFDGPKKEYQLDVFDLDGIKNAISLTSSNSHACFESLPVDNRKKVQSSLQAAAFQSDNIKSSSKINTEGKLNYSAVAKKNLLSSKEVVDNFRPAESTPFSEKLIEHENHPNPGFTLEDYGRALYRMTESLHSGAAEFSETLLREMLDKFASGHHGIRPDGACYNSVIHAYAQCGNAEKAESILRLMFNDYQDGNEKAEPNVRVYTNVLHAWRKAKAPNAPERCETILKEMYELSDKGILPSCKPDTFAVTVLLHCWTESNRKGAALRAETIFRKMKNRYLSGEQAQCPDCIAYSIVLNKFAQENMYEAAEGILFEMVEDFLTGNDSAQPRARNFNTILAMYSKSKTDDAPQKAEQVVNRFRSLSASGVLNVCPDEYTYSLLLKTWVTSTRRDGIDQAVSCLQWMRELSQSGDLAATPDIVKYTTIISAYARSGMFQQAGDLLSKMIEDFKSGNDLAKPDYKAFDIVIAACCGWNHVTSFGRCNGQLAEHFLHQMWELHQSDKVDDLRPKASMYKSVIICYKKSRDAEQAERVLQDMDFLYKAGRLDAGPSKKLFQTVVNAWHESFRMDKQSRLQKVRMEMNERFGRNPIESKFPFDSYFHE